MSAGLFVWLPSQEILDQPSVPPNPAHIAAMAREAELAVRVRPLVNWLQSLHMTGRRTGARAGITGTSELPHRNRG